MPDTFQLNQLDTESIQLPQAVADKLRAEAKKSRLSVAEFLMQWLETQQDIRDSKKVLVDIQSGKTKAIPWATARKELLDAL